MSLFERGVAGVIGDLVSGPTKGCKDCYEEEGLEVAMEATETWHPGLCGYVDAWECPECDRQVIRGDLPDGSAEIGTTSPEDLVVETSQAPSGWWR